MLYDAEELKTLANAYNAATGMRLSRIAREATGRENHHIFVRLADGRSITSKTAEQLSRWFDAHWHETGVPWPLGSRAA